MRGMFGLAVVACFGSCVAVTGFAEAASAAAIAFHVVGFPADGHVLAVKLNGAVTPLAVGDDRTVWSGTVQASAGDEYRYVVANASTNAEVAAEPFVRSIGPEWATAGATPNQMFNRSTTTAEIPALPQAFPSWPHGYASVFNPSYIPTVHITSSVVPYDGVYSAAASGTKVTMVLVTFDKVYKRTKVTLSLGGNSNADYRKRQLKLKLNNQDEIDGRSAFKFRTGARDPSFLREKTYMDIANSLGLPTQQGCHARMFFNGRFFGVYLMEDLMRETWARQVLNGGKDPVSAMLTDSGYGFDFVYRGDDLSAYEDNGYHVVAWGPGPNNPIADLIPVIKKINQFDPKKATDAEVQELQSLIDFDLVYRHACLEYLAIHWDGSWHSASNLLFTYTNGKWFFAPTDFDMTLGVVISASRGGLTAPYTSWTKPADANSTDGQSYTGRPLFDNTLPHPTFKRQFEGICKQVVQTVFHPEAVRPRLKALHDLLRDDIADDRNPEKFTPPPDTGNLADYHWTVGHFDYGYDDGNWAAHGVSCEYDCDAPGILKFIDLRANFLASQLGFTFRDTYTAPSPAEVYGGIKASKASLSGAGSTPTITTTATSAAAEDAKTVTAAGSEGRASPAWVSALALAVAAWFFLRF